MLADIKNQIMKQQTKIIVALFLAGFFAKDIIDNLFFLYIDQYPLRIFGFDITANSHKVMLVVSIILTVTFLYYSFKQPKK